MKLTRLFPHLLGTLVLTGGAVGACSSNISGGVPGGRTDAPSVSGAAAAHSPAANPGSVGGATGSPAEAAGAAERSANAAGTAPSAAQGNPEPGAAPGPVTTPENGGSVGLNPAAPPPSTMDNSPIDASYSIYDHGKECFESLGVEVPTINCDGPDSSRLKVEVDGNEVTTYTPDRCDKPGLVDPGFSCVPGGRVTKYSKTNAAGQTVVTAIVCRRGYLTPIDSGQFDNVAILQSNLQTHDTCWYQIRFQGEVNSRNLTPPYKQGRAKYDYEDQEATKLYVSPRDLVNPSQGSECFRCHDNQVFLRTPWIDAANQVPAASGNDNQIPHTQGQPHYPSRAYQAWNSHRPLNMYINAARFDQAVPPSSQERAAIAAGTMAPSDTCTGCHPISKTDIASSIQGTCNHFARFFMPYKGNSWNNSSTGRRMSDHGQYTFPLNAWMPPSAATQFSSHDAYQSYYSRAFSAVETCCDNPSTPGCTGN